MNNLAMLSGNQATSLAPDIATTPSALPHSMMLTPHSKKVTMCVTPLGSTEPFPYQRQSSIEFRSLELELALTLELELQGGKEGLRKLVASAFAMWAKLAAQSKEGGGGGMVRQGAKEKEGGLPTEIDVYCSDFKAGKQVMEPQSRFAYSWQLDVATTLSSTAAAARWS
jgi:hypothetical protein